MTDQIAAKPKPSKRATSKRGGRRGPVSKKEREAELLDQRAMIDRSLESLRIKTERPASILDFDEVAINRTLEILSGCAAIQCTKQEAAGTLGVSVSTLTDFFKRWPQVEDMWDVSRASGKGSLRRWQWKYAEKGNPQLLQFLGVNELGQIATSKQRVEHDFGKGLPINIKSLSLVQLRGFVGRLREGLGLNPGQGSPAIEGPNPPAPESDKAA